MTDYRKGSMAAAENKTTTYFKIAMTVVTIGLIILLCTVPLLRKEAGHTGWGLKVLSVASFVAAFLAIALEKKYRNSVPENRFYIVWFIGVGVGFFFAICGGI